jgi:hypothetical protein
MKGFTKQQWIEACKYRFIDHLSYREIEKLTDINFNTLRTCLAAIEYFDIAAPAIDGFVDVPKARRMLDALGITHGGRDMIPESVKTETRLKLVDGGVIIEPPVIHSVDTTILSPAFRKALEQYVAATENIESLSDYERSDEHHVLKMKLLGI